MISFLSRTIEPSGRHIVAPRGPRLEWDSLSRCMIPVALPNDREPSELARGDVMLGGPWSMRGDLHELRESDRHERLRRAVLSALGYYDARRPNFDAPSYAWRREQAEKLLCFGAGGGVIGSAVMSPPIRQPWQFTSAGRYYDAGFGVTLDGGSLVDSVANGGADGATYDAANSSSTLTKTSAWSGSLDALTATATGANDRLNCGGTAADWRVHSGNPWTAICVGQVTDTGAPTTRAFFANRATPQTNALLGTALFYSTSGLDVRATVHNGSAVVLTQQSSITTQKFAFGMCISSTHSSSHVRSPSLLETFTGPHVATPSDTDTTGAMTLCAGTTGFSPLHGHLAIALFHQLDSAGYLQSTVDHCRALARL